MNHQLLSKKLLLISVVIGLLFCLNIEIVDAFYGSGSNVVQLTPNNFKSKVVNSNSVVLVEFYAPWCGHCKSLTPTWERAATILKGVATVAAIDADAHKAIAQEYGIQGFPTIKVFVPGKPPVDYQGARDAKPIAEFALKQVKALLKDRFKQDVDGGVLCAMEIILCFELIALAVCLPILLRCGHCKKLAPEWKKAAKNLQGKVKLGHVNCDDEKSLMSRYKVEGFPTILVFGADKESPLTYEGARSASAIESFGLVMLETNVAPPEVTELTSPDVLEEKCGSAAICFVAFLPDILDSKAEGRNKYLETLLSVAEKFKKSPYRCQDSVSKAFLDTMDKKSELEKHVGVGGYGYPALIALNVKKGAYAPLKGAFEREQMMDLRERRLTRGKTERSLEEDEFSLEELMGDSTAEKDEL
ncbi:disulfide isomerase-like protein 2-3 [Tanacetum coccineum]